MLIEEIHKICKKYEIHIICKKYEITNYIINEDLSIDVDGNVDLSFRKLDKIPLKFRNVTGSFYCSSNYLTSLDSAPSSVGGNFYSSNNNLTSLEGAPISVGGCFYCHNNPLESLKGIPFNLSEKDLSLPREYYSYSDYLEYCKVVERDIKFRKILK